jgi:type I restriction enzyme, S subunit
LTTPIVQLGDKVEVISGYAFKSSWFGSGSDPVVRIGDLSGNRIDLSNAVTIDNSIHKINDKYKIREGDILMALSGATTGKIGVADQSVSGAFVNQRVAVIRADKEETQSYLKHLFAGNILEGLLLKAGGAAQANLSPKAISEIKIPLPPLPEQRRIAAILDKADALRQKRRQAIEKLDQLLQSVFLDMFGDPVTNPKVPTTSLGDHLTFLTSGGRGWAKYYNDSGDRFIRSLDVQMNAISDEEVVFVSAPDNAEAKRTKISAGDVLLTITGSRIGRVSAVPRNLEGSYVSQHVAILRPAASILAEFLSYFLSISSGGQRQIAKLQYGQTKPGLNFKQIQSFEIPVPEIHEQRKFVSLVKLKEAQQQNMYRHLNSGQQLFQSLQQRAFNGTL